MTGVTTFDMHRSHQHQRENERNSGFGGGFDLEEQRAILAQIEREKVAAAAVPSSPGKPAIHGSPSFNETCTPSRRERESAGAPARRRSRSLELSVPPEEFAGMLASQSEAAESHSPGVVRRSHGSGGCSGGVDPPSPSSGSSSSRWDMRGTTRRIFEEGQGGLAPPPPVAAGANFNDSAVFGAAGIDEQLAAMTRMRLEEEKNSEVEREGLVSSGASGQNYPTHRQHQSLPASSFSGRGGVKHHQDYSVHFDESAVEEQRAIMEEIERERRLQEWEQQSMHRQHKSLPAEGFGGDSVRFDDGAVEEQMAIFREIEKQQREEQQRKRQEEEERQRQQQWQPTHRQIKSVPAESSSSFFGNSSVEEQRAIIERIARENGKSSHQQQHDRAQEKTPQGPTHRQTKSFPASRPPGSSSSDAFEKIKYRPSSSGISAGAAGRREEHHSRMRHLQTLDERVARKRGQFAGLNPTEGGSFSSTDETGRSSDRDRRQRHAGGSSPKTGTEPCVPVSAESFSSPAQGSVTSKRGPSFSDDIGSSSSSSFADAGGPPGVGREDTYKTGRHTVVLVDGRDAVARGGGRKKVVICAGCSKRLTVSRTCEVVYCPKCETLTPVALSDEVGAWGQS